MYNAFNSAAAKLAQLLPLRRGAAAPVSVEHLEWARALVRDLAPQNNTYGTPVDIVWAGPDGAAARNRSDAPSFLTRLLEQAYGRRESDLRNWLGRIHPTSRDYHQAIVSQKGFLRVLRVSELQPGHLLAIDYRRTLLDSDGHVAVVSGVPVDHGVAFVRGQQLRMYEVRVIDCSRGYHGYRDTRYTRRAGASPGTGVGEGLMRLYAHPATDQLAGYAWSDVDGSEFQGQAGDRCASEGRHLALGQLAAGWSAPGSTNPEPLHKNFRVSG